MTKRSSDQPGTCGEPAVLVLGDAAVDWVVEVEALPRRDGIVLSRSCRRFAGGSAANVAVGLARLGCRVGFVGQLGDDENGDFLRRAFQQEGVDTSGVVEIPRYETPSCWVAVDERGDHMIIALPRDLEAYEVGNLDLGRLATAQGIYIGPSHTGIARKAAIAAKQNGIPVFYAPGALSRYVSRAELAAVLDRTDVLLVSRSEAAALADRSSTEEAVNALLDAGPAAVVETAGSEGALVAAGERRWHVPALSVTKRRDTTGAGDAFAAGFVAAFLRGLDLPAAASVGSAVAALKIQHLGARTGLPSWEQALSRTNIAKATGRVS
ncbi:MAG: carbohydrate kinase family protein [Anaerolineae bacterium]